MVWLVVGLGCLCCGVGLVIVGYCVVGFAWFTFVVWCCRFIVLVLCFVHWFWFVVFCVASCLCLMVVVKCLFGCLV